MMMKDFDYRSYIIGCLTGLAFLIVTLGVIGMISRDIGNLRKGQSQDRGNQYEMHVITTLLQGIAEQLDMSVDDVWNELNAGKTLPELFEEHEKAMDEGTRQGNEEEAGIMEEEAGTEEGVEGTGEMEEPSSALTTGS